MYEACPTDMYLQVNQFFPHGYEPRGWLCCVRLRSLALTRKSLMLLLRLISYNGRSYKHVISTGGMKLRCESVC